jgi:phospholipid/cholesterol/gamma-HCH transport system substrate-binding protein
MPRTRSITWSELKVGVVTMIALVIAVAIIVAVGRKGGFFWEQYQLVTRFHDVAGLKAGAVVRVAGKEVGQVASVEFAGDEVEVRLSLNEAVRHFVTTDSRASLGSLSLLGEPILDITAAPQGQPLADGGMIPSAPSKGSFSDLAASASQGLGQLDQLLADLRAGRGTAGKLIVDDALYSHLRDASAAVADVAQAVSRGRGTLGGLVNDPKAFDDLKAATAKLNDLLGDMRNGKGPFARFINDEAMGQSWAKTTSNIETITARLNGSEGSMGLLLNDRDLYDRLNKTAGSLNDLAEGVKQGRGTLGRLAEDAQLYDNLNGAVTDLRALIEAIRTDPKKYLSVKVSIF